VQSALIMLKAQIGRMADRRWSVTTKAMVQRPGVGLGRCSPAIAGWLFPASPRRLISQSAPACCRVQDLAGRGLEMFSESPRVFVKSVKPAWAGIAPSSCR
jgi:hypothetical protein